MMGPLGNSPVQEGNWSCQPSALPGSANKLQNKVRQHGCGLLPLAALVDARFQRSMPGPAVVESGQLSEFGKTLAGVHSASDAFMNAAACHYSNVVLAVQH